MIKFLENLSICFLKLALGLASLMYMVIRFAIPAFILFLLYKYAVSL